MDITAIESTFSGPNATLKRYDDAIRILGGAAGGPYPDPGALFHWVAEVPHGLRIVNVFWTKEQYDVFAETKLVQVREEVGLPVPSTTYTEVARFLTAGR